MKKLIYILTILGYLQGFSQELKTISYSELNFELNKDSTEIKVKKAEKYLNGKYKLILNLKENRYSLNDFKNGKIIGLQKTYQNEILIRTTEYKNGKKNGYEIYFDKNGEKPRLKILYVESKKIELIRWDNNGNELRTKDERNIKTEYEEYLINNQK